MPDYFLGRAHGEIELEYDGRGADQAARGMDKVTAAAESTDKSLQKTQKTLRETDREFTSAGSSAEGYRARLDDVRRAANEVEAAERHRNSTLLDSRATLKDIEAAEDRVTESRKRHSKAISVERDAHRALSDSLGGVLSAASDLTKLMPSLHTGLGGVADASSEATGKASGLAKVLSIASTAAMVFGQPEITLGLKAVAGGMGGVGSSAGEAAGSVVDFVKSIAGFEVAFGKISGLTLAVPSLAGLAGLGGASAVQGLVGMADAVKQLSGALGVLPAVMSAVEFSSATLQVAFHGVADALQDMMADDPKKFLQDIANMGPFAAQTMLQIAQFRDGFKGSAGAVQDSFFAQIVNDVKPLIQTWLPAVTTAMVKVSGVFGEAAHQLAGVLMQPESARAFTAFVDNLAAGLKALEPAIEPLVGIFTQLVTVGSSFFGQIGGQVTTLIRFFADLVDKASGSGALSAWIQDAITGFDHLINVAYLVSDAFFGIMDVAEKFGGGGLLAWLEQLAQSFDGWTKSAEGPQTLLDFFSTIRTATDSLGPMLKPLVEGIGSIAGAFVKLGVGIAPGWQALFDAFASTMTTAGPQIVGIAPALNTFLRGLADAFTGLMGSLGPQLPQIFQSLANGFVALLPQIGPLVSAFVGLVEGAGPQLPGMFASVTSAVEGLLPYLPMLVSLVEAFIKVTGGAVEVLGGFVGGLLDWGKGLATFLDSIPGVLGKVWDTVQSTFGGFVDKAFDWGKTLIQNLINGLLDATGLTGLANAAQSVMGTIAKFMPSSPAKEGPFSGSGYTLDRGRKMMQDYASGMMSAQGAVEDASRSTAQAAAGALGGVAASAGGAPAATGSDAVGGALLPPNIASADTSILSAYLRHQFDDNRGLKGLAKDLGNILQAAQSGFNLITQGIMQPLFQGLGMLPGANDQRWVKMSPEQIAAQQQAAAEKDAVKKGPNWQDVLGPGVSPGGAGQANSFPWDKVAAAESSGNWQNADTGGNGHFGGLQFSPETWKAFGGLAFAARPDLATREQQIEIANRTAFTGYNGTKPQGLAAWETITKGMVPGVTVDTKPGPASTTGRGWAGPPPEIADYANWYPNTATTSAIQPQGSYGLPRGTNTGGYGTGTAKTFPEWVMALADQFGLKPSTYGSHQETDRFLPNGQREPGYAPNPDKLNRGIDWTGSVENMQKFADWLKANEPNLPGLEQIIWENPQTGQRVGLGGHGNLTTGYYPDTGEGSYAEHRNHVHTRQSAPILFPVGSDGQAPPGQAAGLGNFLTQDLVLPSGAPLSQLVDDSAKNLSVNDRLLNAYLQGNPALAQQIDAAKTPGASDDQVLTTLNTVSSTIKDLQAQDAVGNKNTIAALQSTQTQIAQSAGFQQAPNAISAVSGAVSGVGSAITSVFQVAQGTLDALAATQDIADRLVYGLRSTADVGKIVDDIQKYITLAADVAGSVASIASAVGSILGAAGGADPSGGASGAATAVQGVAAIAGLVQGALAGVNMAIDYAQQIAHIVGTYTGRILSRLVAGYGGTPLMGDVRFLLNKNTGQLITYSEDNPGNQNTLNGNAFINGLHGWNGSNPNPQNNIQWNVYAGPGQSPGEMLNEVNWMYETAGTNGAMSAANF